MPFTAQAFPVTGVDGRITGLVAAQTGVWLTTADQLIHMTDTGFQYTYLVGGGATFTGCDCKYLGISSGRLRYFYPANTVVAVDTANKQRTDCWVSGLDGAVTEVDTYVLPGVSTLNRIALSPFGPYVIGDAARTFFQQASGALSSMSPASVPTPTFAGINYGGFVTAGMSMPGSTAAALFLPSNTSSGPIRSSPVAGGGFTSGTYPWSELTYCGAASSQYAVAVGDIGSMIAVSPNSPFTPQPINTVFHDPPVWNTLPVPSGGIASAGKWFTWDHQIDTGTESGLVVADSVNCCLWAVHANALLTSPAGAVPPARQVTLPNAGALVTPLFLDNRPLQWGFPYYSIGNGTGFQWWAAASLRSGASYVWLVTFTYEVPAAKVVYVGEAAFE